MHPVLFTIFGARFYTYGFLLGWAFFASAQTAAYMGARDGIDRTRMLKHAALCILFGYLGSHLHYILTQPPEHRDFGEMLSLRYDGFTFYGAIIAGALAGIPVTRILEIPYWLMSDAAAIAISIAHGIGRLGCFFRGCDYGLIATGKLAWLGVSFPRGEPGIESPAWQDQVAAGLIPRDATRSLPVIPTQLLEVGVELGLTTFLFWFLTRRKPRPRAGSAFLIYWVVYGLLRAALEQVRGDSDRGMLLGVSTSTAIGLLTSTAALLLLTVPPLVRLRPLRPPEPVTPPAETADPALARRAKTS